MKDSQRTKLYNAEDAALMGIAKKFERFEDVVTCCLRVVHSVWAEKHFAMIYVLRRCGLRVLPGRAYTRAWASSLRRTVNLPVGSRFDYVVLHEMTHVLIQERPAHGWKFCRSYLMLVYHFMGAAAGDALKKSFKERHVRYKEPRRRLISEEQKEACIERLKMARMIKQARKQAEST